MKIFEAMAMEKAVVSTSLGAEGLKVTPGEHIELADDPQSFADQIVGLLTETTRRRRMARVARHYVHEHFSAESVARQFEEICKGFAETKTARSDSRDGIRRVRLDGMSRGSINSTIDCNSIEGA